MTAFPVHVLDSGKKQMNIPFTESKEVKETEKQVEGLTKGSDTNAKAMCSTLHCVNKDPLR